MKRLTRAPSTGFQVFPSTLKCVPITTPSEMARMSRTLSMVTPVLARTGTSGTASRTVLRFERSTGSPVNGPETRIASASDEKTALFARKRDRALVERMGELGVDVEQELHVVAAETVAQPEGAGAVGLPEPHVGREQAGEDLAHEARARRSGNGDAGERIPEIIDAERHLEMRLNGLDDGGHRRPRLPAAP